MSPIHRTATRVSATGASSQMGRSLFVLKPLHLLVVQKSCVVVNCEWSE